jgi:opacity protein-like surface antigen
MILGKLIRTGVAAIGALAASSVTQANAADIYSGGGLKDVPAPPCCSFAGFYIGGHMGMAWSEAQRGDGVFSNAWTDQYNVVHVNPVNIGREKLNSTNGFGGGQLGYNFQNNCCWLYGVEVDLGALALNRNFHRFTPVGPNGAGVVGVELDGDKDNNAFFAGDVTARLGYTFANSLVYVKGGFAFVDVGNRLNETIFWSGGGSTTFGNNNNNDNWATGWVVGAGYEWKPCCQSSWSIKVEYLHFDFSNNDNNCCNDIFNQKFPGIVNNRFRFDRDVTADTVKIGFNYFWNTPAAPLK